jgi:LacI family transcriptional regulator
MKSPKRYSSTIYDVAAMAGLSISTVSRVLNSPDQVNEATRNKVLAAIEELGYVPKAEARARALHSTRRIGVLTPFFTQPSFVQRLRGVAAYLAKTNYELIIYTVESLQQLKGYLVTLPLTSSLDGLIVMSLPFDEIDSKRFIDNQLEVVVTEFHQDYFSTVEIDDFTGGKMAAQYLVSKGHRRLAYMGDLYPPNYAVHPTLSRLDGFTAGLAEANITLPEEYILASPFDQENSRKAARHMLSLPERPSAVFASADVQAIAAMKVAGEMGLRIPKDLAVIGFDDLDIADYVGLTTICQQLDESGRIAAELLLSRLSSPSRPVQHVTLPLSVIERDTV